MPPLDKLKIGAACRIESVSGASALRGRLLDIGMTPGAQVVCLFSAPGGDPRAYLVMGSVFALRNRDAEKVGVTL